MGRLLLVLVLSALGMGTVAPDSAPASERTPAEAVEMPPPEYPAEALRDGVEGTVVIEFQIDETGRVARAWVARSVPGLDSAAIETVRAWRFKPALRDGTPVSTLARAPVEFRITERPLPDSPAGFDLDRAARYGESLGEIPYVTSKPDICHTLGLTGPAFRVARLVRRAREGGGEVDPSVLRRQASGTLNVTVRGGVNVAEATSYVSGPMVMRGIPVQTCPMRVPTRMLLKGGGDELEPLDRIRVGSTKLRDRRGQEWPVFLGVGLFDWHDALTMSRKGNGLTIVVEFSKGKSLEAWFDEEAVRELTPEWAGSDSRTHVP